jgi:hypothetical protein
MEDRHVRVARHAPQLADRDARVVRRHWYARVPAFEAVDAGLQRVLQAEHRVDSGRDDVGERAALDLVVQLDEGNAIVQPLGPQQVDEVGQGVGERDRAPVRRDRTQRAVPGVVGQERRALLVLPARHDDLAVVPPRGPEQLQQPGPPVQGGRGADVVPAGALAVPAAETGERERAGVQAGAEQQVRHRADPYRVVAALDRLPERLVQIVERRARRGLGVPAEVPQGDGQRPVRRWCGHLVDPISSPDTKWRWNAKNTIAVGTAATIDAAATTFQLLT